MQEFTKPTNSEENVKGVESTPPSLSSEEFKTVVSNLENKIAGLATHVHNLAAALDRLGSFTVQSLSRVENKVNYLVEIKSPMPPSQLQGPAFHPIHPMQDPSIPFIYNPGFQGTPSGRMFKMEQPPTTNFMNPFNPPHNRNKDNEFPYVKLGNGYRYVKTDIDCFLIVQVNQPSIFIVPGIPLSIPLQDLYLGEEGIIYAFLDKTRVGDQGGEIRVIFPYQRLQTASFEGDSTSTQVVEVHKLGLMERNNFIKTRVPNRLYLDLNVFMIPPTPVKTPVNPNESSEVQDSLLDLGFNFLSEVYSITKVQTREMFHSFAKKIQMW